MGKVLVVGIIMELAYRKQFRLTEEYRLHLITQLEYWMKLSV